MKEGGGFIEINIRWMFGKSGIVLTKKRRQLLESNLPKYFELEYDGEHNTYFISWEEFKKHIKAEEFVEWEEVYTDNFYGTLKAEVERIWAKGKHVIFDIDVAGGLRIKSKFPKETLAVFVKPPSVDELKRRLKQRSTESEDKINMRIAKASVELATAPQFDTIIKNYDLDVAKEEAYKLVKDFISQK